MNDAEIVKRIREGDGEAYSLLVTRYQNAIYGLAYHHLQNFEDARDVTQESFIHAYSRLHQLRETEKFGPWLRQVTVTQCRLWQRRQNRIQPVEDAVSSPHAVERVETRLALQQALACLSPDSRLTVTLFYLHSYSLQEIAEFLEVPVTTIKSRLRNARARLHKELRVMMEATMTGNPLPDDFAVRVIHSLGIQGCAHTLAFSPDGKMLAGEGSYYPNPAQPRTREKVGEMHLWDVKSGQQLHRLRPPHSNLLESVVFSSDSKLLLCGRSHQVEGILWNGEVQLWDVASGTLQRSLGARLGLMKVVALSTDGNVVAGASRYVRQAEGPWHSEVHLWNIHTGDLLTRFGIDGRIVWALAFAPDSKTLALGTARAESVEGSLQGRWVECDVQLWDVATAEKRQAWLRPRAITQSRIAFAPDGLSVATGDGPEGDVLIFDTKTGNIQQTLSGHTDRVYDVQYSPDGKRLATAGADGTVKLWNAADGTLIQTVIEQETSIKAVAFAANGQTLASADTGGNIKMWSLYQA